MNVGLIHYNYPPVVGGVEFVVQGQAREFARHGHAVRVIAGSGKSGDRQIACRIIKKMDAHHPSVSRVERDLRRGKVTDAFPRLQSVLEAELRSAILGLDLVLVHNVMTMHFNLALTAALWNLALETGGTTRWVFWTHDLALLNPDYRLPAPGRFPWSLLKSHHPSARHVAVSHLRRRQLSKLMGARPESVAVIPNGIDARSLLDLDPLVQWLCSKQKYFEQDVILFCPTRILRRKNLEFGIGIVAALKKRGTKATLLLTGAADPYNPASGEYRRRIQTLIRRKRLRSEVVLIADRFPVGLQQLRGLYRISDALLMTSRQEGFGLPVLEAGLFGKPVICPRSPPFTELAGRTAIFFEPNDTPDAAAKRIIQSLSRDRGRTEFKRVIRNHSWQAVWNKHLAKLVKGTRQNTGR